MCSFVDFVMRKDKKEKVFGDSGRNRYFCAKTR